MRSLGRAAAASLVAALVTGCVDLTPPRVRPDPAVEDGAAADALPGAEEPAPLGDDPPRDRSPSLDASPGEADAARDVRAADGPGALPEPPDGPTVDAVAPGPDARFPVVDAPSPVDSRAPEPQPDLRPTDPAPPAPASVEPDWHFDGVQVAWSESAGAERYTLKRGETPGGPFTVVAAGLTERRAIDRGVAEGAQHYYLVEAHRGTASAASVAVSFRRAPNLVVNGSFEQMAPTQTPPYWSTWWPQSSKAAGAAADYVTDKDGARSGTFHLTQSAATPAWAVFTMQLLATPPPGKYRVRAWVRTANAPTAAVLQIKYCTGVDILAEPISATATWQELTVDFEMTGTKCEIGFWADGVAGSYIDIDDVAVHQLP